ncbi:FAD-dependent oxidoreductase [Aerococcus sp. UMB7834]|uniref:FAD-dependent oxidoreductase n=1 Tax=Aerococcus sp. UMB7834 TaxID=3046342 RepID=UPI00254F7B17|nr:FAD-dependent oxidoreductase [Aerococcus sp. UMB7834]MDK6804507.1 FAD-dependent oxidoreductase [Aerococcus sp. UMB7834]
MKVVVVGTSHAGYEMVQTLLKADQDIEIDLYESGSTMSFLSCGIQSYLEDKSDHLDDLHYATEDSYKKQGINAYTNSQVVAIDSDAKEVTVKDDQGEHQVSYDKLFLSPGAVPVELPIEGTDLDHVYYLRGRDWADRVKKRMAEAKEAVVVGGGYIGIEAAEAFTKAGIKTTVIDSQDRILPTYLDKEFTEVLEAHAADKGLDFHGNECVQSVEGKDGQVAKVITDKGEYPADTVLFAVGVKPNTEWLKGTLELDDKGFVKVNEYLESSVKDIYVAGDATEIPFNPTGKGKAIALASNARRQAVAAAQNIIAGENKVKSPSVNGTSGLALFDYHFAATGVKDCDKAEIDGEVESQFLQIPVLPKFMKDDQEVFMKIHYRKDDHKLVGAQIMSTMNLARDINTLSVAISAGWTLEDLALADFFFQPEYDNTWHYFNQVAQEALGQRFGSDKQLF